jgi:hypothetical protein
MSAFKLYSIYQSSTDYIVHFDWVKLKNLSSIWGKYIQCTYIEEKTVALVDADSLVNDYDFWRT